MDNLVFWALNRNVIVKVDGLRVEGHLIAVQESSRGENHRPGVLVLLDRLGRAVILRDWQLIAEVP